MVHILLHFCAQDNELLHENERVVVTRYVYFLILVTINCAMHHITWQLPCTLVTVTINSLDIDSIHHNIPGLSCKNTYIATCLLFKEAVWSYLTSSCICQFTYYPLNGVDIKALIPCSNIFHWANLSYHVRYNAKYIHQLTNISTVMSVLRSVFPLDLVPSTQQKQDTSFSITSNEVWMLQW